MIAIAHPNWLIFLQPLHATIESREIAVQHLYDLPVLDRACMRLPALRPAPVNLEPLGANERDISRAYPGQLHCPAPGRQPQEEQAIITIAGRR
ncbi:MAG TPA: hypothetical protein VFV38_10135 [Ktedonobacteraceae bacterium]|nr:hypothetical protein [Ktedonobacteraceae bacterium]